MLLVTTHYYHFNSALKILNVNSLYTTEISCHVVKMQ